MDTTGKYITFGIPLGPCQGNWKPTCACWDHGIVIAESHHLFGEIQVWSYQGPGEASSENWANGIGWWCIYVGKAKTFLLPFAKAAQVMGLI